MANEKLTRLREKQKTIAEQIRREESRLNAEERKKDTRRKVLVGAAILNKAENESQYKTWLINTLLNGFLTRGDDRALFGLSPLPPAPVKEEKEVSERENEKEPT